MQKTQSNDMQGKVALVTGGTSGIGRAAALAFAQRGAKVAVAGRRASEGQQTVKLITDAGGEGIFIQADVTDEKAIEHMVNETMQAYDRIDYACNNAGTLGNNGPLIEQTSENFTHIIETNVTGVFWSMKYELPQIAKNGGAIVNMSSVAGEIGFPGMGLYVASKHAVNGLTRTAALEFAEQGVRVNAVSPGGIQTDMLEQAMNGNSAMRDFFTQLHPMKRFGKPEEIAQAVVWLCSDAASFVTGQVYAVDGGFTTQ